MMYLFSIVLCMNRLPSLTGFLDSLCMEDGSSGDSSEECWESGCETSDGSLFLPTPEHPSRVISKVSPIDLPHVI